MEPQQILDLPMNDNDAGAKTIREYLKAIVAAVFNEGEGFSGKRPFGNSGWEYELFEPLETHGLIKEDDRKAGRKLIQAAIAKL